MKQLKTIINTVKQILAFMLQKLLLKSGYGLLAVQPLVRRKAEQLIERMFAKGRAVMVYQGYRSEEEQNYLYAQGRSRKGPIVTNARGGESLHNYGVAIDVVFLVNGHPSWDNGHDWNLLGKEGKTLGFEWGGDWKEFPDRPHFQFMGSYTLDDFKNKRIDYSRYE